ncbi:MAG: ERF family protein [Lachnospiraceae bacterium]|nr:ERF family protein [Lachnospiraceae bacterium]
MEQAGVPKIYEAITNVMSEIGCVAKDKVNKQQGFKFRSVDDVYNVLHPALAKNKVFIVPEILEQTRSNAGETRNGGKMTLVICRIKFTFYAEDGSSIETTLIGEGLDTGDKGTNKAMAIAYKYACFQVFCIPTEEMVDPDSKRPELDPLMNKPDQKKNVNKKPEHRKEPDGKPSENTDFEEQQAPDPNKEKVTDIMIQTIQKELNRTGVKEDVILNLFKASSISEFSIAQFNKVMKKFENTPSRKEESNE